MSTPDGRRVVFITLGRDDLPPPGAGAARDAGPGRRAEEYASLDDGELAAFFDDFRHARSLEQVATIHPTVVVLIATDQPDPGRKDTDTLPAAGLVQRLITAAAARRGLHVEDVVIEVLRVASPNTASEELAAEMNALVDRACTAHQPAVLVDIQPGGTPAMRVLLEHAVGLAAGRWGVPAERLRSNPGQDPDHSSLLALIDAESVHRRAAQRIVDAVDGARFHAITPDELPADLRAPVGTLLELGRRIAERRNPGGLERSSGLPDGFRDRFNAAWSATELHRRRFELRLGTLRGAERDRRWEDALSAYVTATELLPAVLAEHLAPEVLGRSMEVRDLLPTSLNRVCFGNSGTTPVAGDTVTAARWACRCAQRGRHRNCDIADDRLPLTEALREHSAQAKLAFVLRDGGQKHAPLVRLRHDVVHTASTTPTGKEIREKITRQYDLADLTPPRGEPTLHGLLTAAFKELTGGSPRDPLGVVSAAIRDLLRPLTV